MAIDIVKAFTYPFRGQNWLQTMVIPGGIMMCYFVFVFMMAFFVGITAGIAKVAGGGGDPSTNPAFIMMQIFNNLLSIPINIFIFGYLWLTVSRINAQGLDTPAPKWLDNLALIGKGGAAVFGYFFGIGIIVALIFIVLAIGIALIFGISWKGGAHPGSPAIIMMVISCVLVFLALAILSFPYLMAPMIYSASTGKIGDILQFEQSWQLARQHYWQVLLAVLYSIGMTIAWLIGMLMVCLTIVGVLLMPFLMFGLQVAQYHLFAQAYGLGQNPSAGGDLQPQPV